MDEKGRMLAEALDSSGEAGPIPPDVKALAELGLRLRDGCPSADPAFIQSLGHTLQREWTRLACPAQSGLARTRLWRLAAIPVAVAVLFLGIALRAPGVEMSVEAGLGRVITAFRHTRVELAPMQTITPPAVRSETYPSVEEAQAAVGFRIRVPSYLPNGLALDEVTVSESEGQRWVVLQYSGTSMAPLALGPVTIQEYQAGEAPAAQALTFQAGAEGVQSIQVDGKPALWVQGHWTRTGRWERGGQDGVLMVQSGDVLVQVAGRLSQQECVRIAESMLR